MKHFYMTGVILTRKNTKNTNSFSLHDRFILMSRLEERKAIFALVVLQKENIYKRKLQCILKFIGYEHYTASLEKSTKFYFVISIESCLIKGKK